MEYENVKVNSERWFDLKTLLNEEFRDIVGYEGYYQVSNYGRVKSLSRYYHNNNGGYFSKDLILKNNHNIWNYYQIIFSKELKTKSFTIHRLVAKAFIPNTNNYPIINHIDGNKQNNRVDNLEWCTYSHNCKEAFRLGLSVPNPNQKGKFDSDNKLSKKILQCDLNNNFIKIWDSIHQIERNLKISKGNICSCCKGKRTQANGYVWKYYKGDE